MYEYKQTTNRSIQESKQCVKENVMLGTALFVRYVRNWDEDET